MCANEEAEVAKLIPLNKKAGVVYCEDLYIKKTVLNQHEMRDLVVQHANFLGTVS